MYIKNNLVYSEAGKVLVLDNFVGYQMILPEDISKILEQSVNIDDMYISGKYLIYSENKIKQLNKTQFTYKDWKKDIINSRFSNDDQIAIILNKENSKEDLDLFNKMQEWRDWASKLASKIISLNN